MLHTVFEEHFKDFCDIYEEQYANRYGKFQLTRIMDVAEHFLTCGDYLNGVARIRCTNAEYGSEMRVIAVIRNLPEIRKILKHLRKIGRPPPGVDYSSIAV